MIDLEAIKAREKAATPDNIIHPVYPSCHCEGCRNRKWLHENARGLIGPLLAEVERLRGIWGEK